MYIFFLENFNLSAKFPSKIAPTISLCMGISLPTPMALLFTQ